MFRINNPFLPAAGWGLKTVFSMAPPTGNGQPSQRAVPIGPNVFYEPVNAFDQALVNSSPVARKMVNASVVTSNAMSATASAMRGDVFGAQMASAGAWNAWLGLVAPF